MRKHYQNSLKLFFHERILLTRGELEISQEEMAARLSMACRTYIDLEHGKSCCSAVTLMLFLLYLCPDPQAFLDGLRDAFEAANALAA